MEEGSGCSLPRLPWVWAQRTFMLALLGLVIYCIFNNQHRAQREASGMSLKKRITSAADCDEGWMEKRGPLTKGTLQTCVLKFVFLSGPRQDPRLSWQAGPALGRSFLHGLELVDGQLRVHREGTYRLHIQVTLTNCSSTWTPRPRRATLAVGICSPAARGISLLRLSFQYACTVTSQRLTPLARGDTLCTNLTLPLLPSRNADETFFGVQQVHP
ncbi:CD70 antigen [Carlito syrichta]|uniref:CD70 antigen n=1 Tax=Carlito syrichta TaxID=1868482 RepID=A0A1U7T6L4_CARSF|nr:CD70 antigen [Carlito syrichta]